jgi:hypothetical protein
MIIGTVVICAAGFARKRFIKNRNRATLRRRLEVALMN